MQRPHAPPNGSRGRKGGPAGAPSPSRYAGLGLTWAASTLLCLLGGDWLDGAVGTTPVFTLLGAFIGAGAGFYYMYYHTVIEPRRRNRDGGQGSA